MMQVIRWPGIGFPMGTTPLNWFVAGPQGPAANDDKKDK